MPINKAVLMIRQVEPSEWKALVNCEGPYKQGKTEELSQIGVDMMTKCNVGS